MYIQLNKSIITSTYWAYGLKDKTFSYKIERKKIQDLYNDIYDIITKKLKILSDKEQCEKQTEFDNYEKNLMLTRENWNKISKKTVKDSLYEKYAIDIQKEHNLTKQETKRLLSFIDISLFFKTITNKDIIYENGRIKRIEGIEIDLSDPRKKIKIKFNKDIFKQQIPSEPETKVNISVKNLWEKYVKTFEKKII